MSDKMKLLSLFGLSFALFGIVISSTAVGGKEVCKNIVQIYNIPYPLDCKPRVLFFKMDFWVGFNSKYPTLGSLNSKSAFLGSQQL